MKFRQNPISVFDRKLRPDEKLLNESPNSISIVRKTTRTIDGIENVSSAVLFFVREKLDFEKIKGIMAKHLGDHMDGPVYFEMAVRENGTVVKYNSQVGQTDTLRIEGMSGRDEDIQEVANLGNSLIRIYSGMHPKNFDPEVEKLLIGIAKDIEAKVAGGTYPLPRL